MHEQFPVCVGGVTVRVFSGCAHERGVSSLFYECVNLSPRWVCGGGVQGKNVEVEQAVEDLITVLVSYPLSPNVAPVPQHDIALMRTHYNHFMCQVLGCVALCSCASALHGGTRVYSLWVLLCQ